MGSGKCVRTILEFRQLWPLRLMGLAMLVLAGGFVNAAFAQTATGTLTGTITDPKGLAMAGMNVVVHSADTGADQKPALTNDSGVFLVPLLPPGLYDVTASQTGFATVQHKAVTLQVGQTVRVDIEMPVQSQQSLVTVTTEIPLLETEKTEQSTNVSENLVSSLPVSSRRWEQFAFLTPGVNPDGATGGISFHGLNSMYNNNSVDGANNTNAYNAGARGGTNDGYVYSGDSIREFQVSSSGFSAELGQAAGGSVNAVTKSGTNQLHGDLFYNGRAANFNAVDPVAKINAASSGTPATQSVHQQHQWGGSLGGPLIKDKLFFFFTDDGYRKVNPQTVTTNQLSPSIKALTCPTLTAAGGYRGRHGAHCGPVSGGQGFHLCPFHRRISPGAATGHRTRQAGLSVDSGQPFECRREYQGLETVRRPLALERREHQLHPGPVHHRQLDYGDLQQYG